jgi:hypothetical protein
LDSKNAVIEFARHALRAEFLTPAGVINLVSLFSFFVLILSLGLLDVIQAIVRTWDSSYTTGSESFLLLCGLYALVMLLCVLIVGLLTRRTP